MINFYQKNIVINSYFDEIFINILKIISSAKESLKICVAWITADIYINEFNKLISRGVTIEIIINDDVYNKRNNNIKKLSDIGIYVHQLKPLENNTYMHNKFCIIDDEILITGSFNWTKLARRHFENIVVIKNDYKLIKSFIMEFIDLKNYATLFSQKNKDIHRCSICKSIIYNIGILGHGRGKYNTSLVEIWSVCSDISHHTVKIAEEYDDYIWSRLGFEDESCDDEDEEYDKNRMLRELNYEKKQIINVQNYFDNRLGAKIHAVGYVTMENYNAYMKSYEDAIYEIAIIWRDIFYRKIIPSSLDNCEGIEKIIDNHLPL